MFRVIEQLRKAIASRRDEMAELTAELVSIDTENPPGRNYERCLRFLGERLEPLDFDADIERIDNGNATRTIRATGSVPCSGTAVLRCTSMATSTWYRRKAETSSIPK